MNMSEQLTISAPESPLSPPSQAETDQQLILLWLRTKRSPKTRAEYARDVEAFLNRLEGIKLALAAVRLVDLQDYADSIATKPPNTQRRLLSSLKSLFSFARRVGYLHFDVGAAVSLPRPKNVLAERILTEEQVMTMIVSEKSFRNRLLLRLLYVSGGRISEIGCLRWRDLQEREGGGQVTLYGKGEKTRAVRLPGAIWTDLQRIRGNPDDYIFSRRRGRRWSAKEPLDSVQLWRIVQKAAKRAGIAGNVSPHWLRHAHASHALDRGANIKIVQETLGHESLQTTSRYTHARPEDSSSLYLAIS